MEKTTKLNVIPSHVRSSSLLSVAKVVGVIILGGFILGGLLTFGARYIRYDEVAKKFEIGDNLEVKGKISGDGSGLTGVNAAKIGGVSISGPHHAGYYHLGAWGVGRTDPNAVLVNTAYRADIASNASNASNADKLSGYAWNNLCYCIYVGGDCAGSGWQCARLGQEVHAGCGDISGDMDWHNAGFKIYLCN